MEGLYDDDTDEDIAPDFIKSAQVKTEEDAYGEETDEEDGKRLLSYLLQSQAIILMLRQMMTTVIVMTRAMLMRKPRLLQDGMQATRSSIKVPKSIFGVKEKVEINTANLQVMEGLYYFRITGISSMKSSNDAKHGVTSEHYATTILIKRWLIDMNANAILTKS